MTSDRDKLKKDIEPDSANWSDDLPRIAGLMPHARKPLDRSHDLKHERVQAGAQRTHAETGSSVVRRLSEMKALPAHPFRTSQASSRSPSRLRADWAAHVTVVGDVVDVADAAEVFDLKEAGRTSGEVKANSRAGHGYSGYISAHERRFEERDRAQAEARAEKKRQEAKALAEIRSKPVKHFFWLFSNGTFPQRAARWGGVLALAYFAITTGLSAFTRAYVDSSGGVTAVPGSAKGPSTSAQANRHGRSLGREEQSTQRGDRRSKPSAPVQQERASLKGDGIEPLDHSPKPKP